VLREGYGLPSHHERLRRRGLLTTHELAERFQVTDSTIRHWGRQGLITNHYPDSRVSLRRDNQDENPATIRMRICRCRRDEGRA
jgi:DNA-binding transcriptional MerR regulator